MEKAPLPNRPKHRPVRHPRWRRYLPNPWVAGTVAIATLIALPVITVTSFIFVPAGEVWDHLVATVLQDYIVNSLILMVGVAAGTLIIGVSTAWLTTMCSFPGRRIFEWALLLPMAFPAYIIAYTYTGLLDFAGPVQTALREWFAWSYGDYWFPELRSIGGAIVMLSLVLYPYVYLLSRAAFLEQSSHAMDASRMLGCGPWRSFLLISLPSARPAIIAGLSLALMETLADYGTVQYFGVSNFTTGIFRTWFGLGDAAAAAQLSALLMTFVFALIVIERWSRSRARYHMTGQRSTPLPTYRLRIGKTCLAWLACGLPLTLGFLLPGGLLVSWSMATAAYVVDDRFWQLVFNSVTLAGSAALFALLLALYMAYSKRLTGGMGTNSAVRLAAMGYAIPGTVIAVGVMLPFGWFDNTIDAWARETFGVSTGLLLSGTLFAVMFAYMVRFLAVSLQTVEAGLGKIRPSMDETARSLGHRPLEVLGRIHLPLMRGSVLTAILLVFVDVMKELPATLILRPFNFNTLAVRAYELATDERLMDASSAAVAIVAAGILPVILLSRSITRSRSALQGRTAITETARMAAQPA
ncbi:MAG: iron(III) transport system permease protein [Gammaproteobacteria bacterium]|nr:MAG: iron(III) transport system permease protein [Gammaproteobacteria bacterium]TND04362.1 MAG: iron(III) transport system permease protein [Gammaproteobacteria bacterium]